MIPMSWFLFAFFLNLSGIVKEILFIIVKAYLSKELIPLNLTSFTYF